MDFAADFVKRAVFQILPFKAGTVHAVHRVNTAAQRLFAECRRIDRQIAALGVTAEHKTPVKPRRSMFKIFQRFYLRGQGKVREQRKILLPADNGVVGSAVGEKPPSVHINHDRRKLHFCLAVHNIDVVREQQIAKARALCRSLQQLGVTLPKHLLRACFVCKKLFRSLAHRDGFILAENAVEPDIRKARENQRVGGVKAVLRKKQVAAPL